MCPPVTSRGVGPPLPVCCRLQGLLPLAASLASLYMFRVCLGILRGAAFLFWASRPLSALAAGSVLRCCVAESGWPRRAAARCSPFSALPPGLGRDQPPRAPAARDLPRRPAGRGAQGGSSPPATDGRLALLAAQRERSPGPAAVRAEELGDAVAYEAEPRGACSPCMQACGAKRSIGQESHGLRELAVCRRLGTVCSGRSKQASSLARLGTVRLVA